jgi:hypothetical protein
MVYIKAIYCQPDGSGITNDDQHTTIMAYVWNYLLHHYVCRKVIQPTNKSRIVCLIAIYKSITTMIVFALFIITNDVIAIFSMD